MFDNIIRRYSLRVYSYAPQRGILLRQGKQVSSALLYAVGNGGEEAVLIRDFVDGEPFRCSLEMNVELATNPAPAIYFPNHICGMKKGELKTLLGSDGVQSDIIPIGNAIIHSPLYNWTDVEVVDALEMLGEPWVAPPEELDTGNIVACTKCMQGTETVMCPKLNEEIESQRWQPESNLEILKEWMFRQE